MSEMSKIERKKPDIAVDAAVDPALDQIAVAKTAQQDRIALSGRATERLDAWVKQVQASSGLLYDVFVRYDPDNLLVQQAQREVLERQLEASRLGRVLERLSRGTVRLIDVERPTPLAFPLLVDSTRAKVSSEKLADRVRRMTASAEKTSRSGATTLLRAR